jgi:hypothetical protein
LQQRIEVAKQNERYVDALSNVSRTRERVAHGHAVSQRPFRSALDHFPIRDRITERHAQLDDVCSRLRELN